MLHNKYSVVLLFTLVIELFAKIGGHIRQAMTLLFIPRTGIGLCYYTEKTLVTHRSAKDISTRYRPIVIEKINNVTFLISVFVFVNRPQETI